MTSKPEDFVMQAWKKQCDTSLRAMETLIEGATKIREAQLEAASFAHADAEATRKAIAAATDPSQLLRLQTEWARANVEKALAYWRSNYQTVMETNAELVKCLYSAAAVAGAGPDAFKGADFDASRQALLGMVDGAYKQWLESVQQLYKPVERASV